jgi:hypothetical protein
LQLPRIDAALFAPRASMFASDGMGEARRIFGGLLYFEGLARGA